MRVCLHCGSTTTYIDKKNVSLWYKHNNEYICRNCYGKLWSKNNPSKVKENHKRWHAINSSKRIQFGNERVYLTENPRKGICSKCGLIGKTHLHHEQYDKHDPLKYTVELCASCHAKETWNLGQYLDPHNERDPLTGRFIRS